MALFIYYIVCSFTFYIYPFWINHNDHCEKLTFPYYCHILCLYTYKIANQRKVTLWIFLWLSDVVSSMRSELTMKHFIKGNNEKRNIWFEIYMYDCIIMILILNQFKFIIFKMFQWIYTKYYFTRLGADVAFYHLFSFYFFSLFLCCCRRRHNHRLSFIF
jgi:hypothetical protein